MTLFDDILFHERVTAGRISRDDTTIDVLTGQAKIMLTEVLLRQQRGDRGEWRDTELDRLDRFCGFTYLIFSAPAPHEPTTLLPAKREWIKARVLFYQSLLRHIEATTYKEAMQMEFGTEQKYQAYLQARTWTEHQYEAALRRHGNYDQAKLIGDLREMRERMIPELFMANINTKEPTPQYISRSGVLSPVPA